MTTKRRPARVLEAPEENIFMVLYDVARLFRRNFEGRMRSRGGLTRAQWQVLATVSRHEGIRQVSLADMLEIEPITLVRLVDRLEAAGLLERRQDPTDRRARALYLTQAATPVIKEMRAIGATCREAGLSGLSGEECAILFTLLQRIRGNLSERPTAPATEPDVSTRDGVGKETSHA